MEKNHPPRESTNEYSSPQQCGDFFNQIVQPYLQDEKLQDEIIIRSYFAEIQRFSYRFYENHHDLLNDGKGIIMQTGWHENTGFCKVGLKNSDTLTIGFSATEHLRGEDLHNDGQGNKYHGNGLFDWKLTRANNTGRQEVCFRMYGGKVVGSRTTQLDRGGRLQSRGESDESEVVSTWSLIRNIIESEKFQEDVSGLRRRRVAAIKNMADLLFDMHTMSHRRFMLQNDNAQLLVRKMAFAYMPAIDYEQQ